jgi:hypothetical protein
MTKTLRFTAIALLLAFGLSTLGCSQKEGAATAEKGHAGAGHEEHPHPTSGPHGGDLVELGNEQYHAEVVHKGEAIVYILDSAAKAPVAIDATEIIFNLTHDGKAEQFKLAAKPAASDAPGKSSVFSSNDAELVADLEEGHAEVQMVLTIDGAQFRGNLEHEHQEGEEHAH